MHDVILNIWAYRVLTPIDNAKIRLQIQNFPKKKTLKLNKTTNFNRKYHGLMNCYSQIYKEHGFFRGIYGGFCVTLIRQG